MVGSGSSSTSSRTSTRSSTSDPGVARPTPAARLAGLVRLTHPFPILLDAAATAAIALLAGGGVAAALRLGLGMLGLQAAIGALNDLVDAPRDAGRKPGKPIPAGLVPRGAAMGVVAVAVAAGLGLSALSGLPTAAVAVLILGVGAVYDLWLKGTPWSWLPFAAGIPLLPVYAWLGATGSLPAYFLVLVPAGVLAGAALAMANALADVERDRAAGVTSIAAHLGPALAWRAHAVLHALVLALATGAASAAGVAPVVVAAAVGGPAIAIALGAALAFAPAAAWRERGWELEAIGVALLAAGWLLVVPRTSAS